MWVIVGRVVMGAIGCVVRSPDAIQAASGPGKEKLQHGADLLDAGLRM